MTCYKPIILITLAVLLVLALISCTQNGVPITPTENSNQGLSTLALIDQALDNGEITAEYRLLYLAYAVYEPESLPANFIGSVGWRPTMVVAELYESMNTPSILCSMSPYVQSEFQRLFNPETTCE